jgi:hypothetical protein
MAKLTLPPYFEVRRPNVPKGRVRLVPLRDILKDAQMRGQVVATLLANAERLEAQAANARDIARELERLGSQGAKGTK